MKRQLKLGQEYPEKGEDTYIFKMARDLIYQLDRMYGPGETRRQAHPKMHALLEGEFIVESDLPQDQRIGVFKEGKTYPCLIRLSSSNTKIQDDYKKDVRGFAIKLLGVEGDKLITKEMENNEQDFLLVSMPTFPIGTVKQFQELLAIVAHGKMGKFLLPQNWPLLIAASKLKKTFVRTSNVLQIPYWSTVPFQYGDKNRAVKYHLVPQSAQKDKMPKHPKSWYLREAIQRTLKASDVWFDFMIQFQEEAKKMPLENAKVKWKSKFHKVATLKIPMQKFATQDQDISGRNSDFSPWHSLPEHRPLGGLNRARRIVYRSLSDYRLKRNGVATESKASI